MAMGMSAADYAAQLTDEALMMSDEYTRIRDEKLRKASKGAFDFLTDAEERQIEAEMMAEIARMRREKLKDYKDIMAQYSGVAGQAGVSTTTAPTSYADYNPTT
jgi:glutamate synthase domain-containing protein 3